MGRIFFVVNDLFTDGLERHSLFMTQVSRSVWTETVA